jgi:hypothetical protein
MKNEDVKYILEAIRWMNENTTVASVDMETYGNLVMNCESLLMDEVNGVNLENDKALNLAGVMNCPHCNSSDIDKEEYFCNNCCDYYD